jgi:hypothetical protein
MIWLQFVATALVIVLAATTSLPELFTGLGATVGA